MTSDPNGVCITNRLAIGARQNRSGRICSTSVLFHHPVIQSADQKRGIRFSGLQGIVRLTTRASALMSSGRSACNEMTIVAVTVQQTRSLSHTQACLMSFRQAASSGRRRGYSCWIHANLLVILTHNVTEETIVAQIIAEGET